MKAAVAAIFSAAKTDSENGPLEIAERELIRSALKQSDSDEAAAAKLLGITKTVLKKRIEKFGIGSA